MTPRVHDGRYLAAPASLCEADQPMADVLGLLERYAASLRGQAGHDAAADIFVSAGLSALRSADRDITWLQYGITPGMRGRTGLYGELRNAAAALVEQGQADEFFYMHKPPGLRIRFQTKGERFADLDTWLTARLDGWRRDELITGWTRGVYEPEQYLFGGPVSMRAVHRVFTADAACWLGYLSDDKEPGPSWAVSLLMIRALLDALGIEGWEDLDVFDRLRWQTHRRLADDLTGRDAGSRLAGTLRAAWADPARLRDLLPPGTRALIDDYTTAVTSAGASWLRDYFQSGWPSIGPREAAAYVIVFHWNRGNIPWLRQALIAEALTARPPGAAP